MIQTYVKKLIENLPDEITKKKEPFVLDLVLDINPDLKSGIGLSSKKKKTQFINILVSYL